MHKTCNRKLKVYLDTSIISHLDAPDTPDKMQDTISLWEAIKANKFEIYISDVTMRELGRCPEPKRSMMIEHLAEIQYVDLVECGHSTELSHLYCEIGGLPPKSKDDALHIAIASVGDCDVILSWNFKHIVNIRAMTAVENVNFNKRYKNIRILSPSMLLEGDD